MQRVLVTGGAGFIGSHLVDRLIQDCEVTALDNLSEGLMENLDRHKTSRQFRFVKGSITSGDDVETSMAGVDTVYHFAAQPDVRVSAEQPINDFETNVVGSMNLLDCMRRLDIKRMVFASSGGTVYGEAKTLPTPESTVLRPISNYGAAKAAFEMYLSSYSELYGINSVSVRFANIIGPRSTHGVIYDFYTKLKQNPTRLEVLGNGTQEKSYMYVSDAVEATIILGQQMRQGYLPVNVGSGERLTVSRIAELTKEELKVMDARTEYSGSRSGWAGDVVMTNMDIRLLRSFGWKPRVHIEDGVRQYIRWLVERFGPVKKKP
ncbi:MAG: UDP-glucose 4-epimerase [Candidatus Thorarchaeota archaeon]|nr:MAG: UDP-glucose 4-epimerase [Candidatus Thorarchaeota archaeon]